MVDGASPLIHATASLDTRAPPATSVQASLLFFGCSGLAVVSDSDTFLSLRYIESRTVFHGDHR